MPVCPSVVGVDSMRRNCMPIFAMKHEFGAALYVTYLLCLTELVGCASSSLLESNDHRGNMPRLHERPTAFFSKSAIDLISCLSQIIFRFRRMRSEQQHGHDSMARERAQSRPVAGNVLHQVHHSTHSSHNTHPCGLHVRGGCPSTCAARVRANDTSSSCGAMALLLPH